MEGRNVKGAPGVVDLQRRSGCQAIVAPRPVLTAFMVALVVRVVAVVGLTATGSWIPDEGTFWTLAGHLMDTTKEGDLPLPGIYGEVPFFVWPLAGIRWVAGSSVLVPRLVLGLVGAATAALTAYGTRAATRGSWAAGLVAGLVVALWPSQVRYSSAVLKDAVVWLALAATFAAVAHAVHVRSVRSRGMALLVGTLAVLLLLGTRPSTGVVAAIALVIAMGAVPAPRVQRTLLVVGAGLVLLLAPWARGYGPAGSGILGSASETATARAEGGASGCTTIRSAAQTQDLGRLLRDVPRGVSLVWFEPYVFQEVCQPAGEVAKVEVVAWYGLLGAAGVSLWRRRLAWRAMVFPTLSLAGLTAAGVLAEVNVGTAFRHRGALLWAVAAMAAPTLVAWWGSFGSRVDAGASTRSLL